jgi:general secretion pathway protein J
MNLWRACPGSSVIKRRSSAGFTLLEVLIALAIAAVIAAMSYQAIEGAAGGAERTREVMAEINQLDRTWQIIAGDMRQVLKPETGARGLRFEFKAESLGRTGDDVEQVLMSFSRRGWVNPMERLRSDLQQVSYRIEEGKLWRDYLPERNVPMDELDFEDAALHQLLLENVTDVQMRFLPAELIQQRGPIILGGLDYTRDWEPVWPRPEQSGQATMPIAVEISIEVKGMGASARLFELTQ